MQDAPLPPVEELYDEAACGLALTSPDGTFLRVNKTLCRCVGWEARELVGMRKLQDLLTMGGRIFHQTHWAPLLQMQGSVAEVKLEIVHKAGQKLPMLMNAVRRQHEGRTFHELSIAVAEDRNKYERELLRARTRAEELLVLEQQSRRDLHAAQLELSRQRAEAVDRALFAEQMIGIVSHDLRNPLSAIQMSAHVLGRGDLNEQQSRVLERLHASTRRVGRLISDLLDFTQARVGQGLKTAPKELDLHALVEECVDELTLSFPATSLIHRRIGQGRCRADSDRLAQLIGNLVANAMTYGSPGRPVTVTSAVESSGFSIAVHNDGNPVPAALLPSIFEPMSRGEQIPSSTRSVGLGLFIVREIARAHHGEVEVTSSLETGTTFTMHAPTAPMPLDAQLPDA
jgi:sigma-B regulation protein RsbU (phosphoserine phosphatase)